MRPVLVAPAIALTATLAMTLAACGGSDAAPGAESGTAATGTDVSIVATTSILGSIAGDIATCAGGSVTTLMPAGADPHDFTPSSAQVAQMVGADIVIANGLGLEEGLVDALDGAAADGATVIEIAELVDPIEFGAGGHSEEEGHSDEGDSHDHGDLDPHVSFDMNRMADAAVIIGDRLAETAGPAYADCGEQVAGQIRDAEAEVRTLLESVPTDRRILVTDHDALGYLAAEYGYEVAGVVIPGGSTLADPSSAELSALVEVIRAEGVPAIFASSANPSALADAVAAEAGSVSVVTLFVDTLGEPGSGAETYASMMLANARLIAEALNG